MIKNNLEAKYLHKTFKNQEQFKKWLSKTTYKLIILEDLGQDLTKIHVDERGEILHCNFHASIYNGQFINMTELEESRPIEIFENGKSIRKMGLVVSEIKKNKTYENE